MAPRAAYEVYALTGLVRCIYWFYLSARVMGWRHCWQRYFNFDSLLLYMTNSMARGPLSIHLPSSPTLLPPLPERHSVLAHEQERASGVRLF